MDDPQCSLNVRVIDHELFSTLFGQRRAKGWRRGRQVFRAYLSKAGYAHDRGREHQKVFCVQDPREFPPMLDPSGIEPVPIPVAVPAIREGCAHRVPCPMNSSRALVLAARRRSDQATAHWMPPLNRPGARVRVISPKVKSCVACRVGPGRTLEGLKAGSGVRVVMRCKSRTFASVRGLGSRRARCGLGAEPG